MKKITYSFSFAMFALFVGIALVYVYAATAYAGSTYTPDEMLVVLGFTIEIENTGSGNDADSAWETCSGGSLNIEIADSSTGSDQFHATTPGHKYVGTLVLRGPLTSGRHSLAQNDDFNVFWSETVKGQPWKRSLAENGVAEIDAQPGKFKIEIDGCPTASANIESITMEDLVIDEREMTTGADWDYRTVGPGDAHFGSITIRANADGEPSEETSQYVCSKKQSIRKNISVINLKRDGSEARRWNIFDSFPTRWDPGEYSPSSNIACETVVAKMQRVELQ